MSMSPRSLLFSSDQKTSRTLSQALNELELDVEHCSEIFTALKRLTAGRFDLLVVDWDEGLDGGFLLKTARELKINSSAFTLIIARGEASAIARQTGAHLVLAKPILPDQVQFALLGCEEFLRRLKTWLPPRNMHGTTLHFGEKGVQSEPVASGRPPQPLAVPSHSVSAPHGHPVVSSAPPNLTFATLEGQPFHKSVLQKVRNWKRPARGSRSKPQRRDTAPLRRAAVIVVFFSVGYVLSQPLSRVAANFVQIYQGAWDRKPDTKSTGKSEEIAQTQTPAEQIPNDDAERPRSRHNSSAKIRVTPVTDPWGSLERKPARGSQAHVQPQVKVQEQPSSDNVSSTAGSRIPASLRSPSPDAAVRSVAASLTPSLLSALEPVILPEQLSEKLLTDKVQPNYPEQAIRAGLQGPVVLQAWIGRDGKIIDLKMIRGSLLLGQAACKAVKQWRYKPYLLNGEAVEAQTYVTVDFRLP
jgi:TonB family protein